MAHHPTLGPLPTSDSNAALQRESLAALHAILPHERVIFRDERTEDLGIDGSLEFLDAENGTNYRVNIQLKARRGLSTNKQDAVPLSVASSNLNYLLNGACPVYVLYRPEPRELRYALAREEAHRIGVEIPDWPSQDSVTILFRHTLTASSVEDIFASARDESRLSRAINDKLVPLSELVWGIGRILDWLNAALSRRLTSIPPEVIRAPAPHIAGPVLLQLSFCSNQEQLREMYANLFATAMDGRSPELAHPAFAQIIQQLTPDEALILNKLATHPSQFVCSERITEYGDHADSHNGEYVSVQFASFCEEAGVSHVLLSESYLDNLLRLKLLKEDIWSEGEFQPDTWYDHGEAPAHVRNINGKQIQLSAFGEQFLNACARQK